MHVWPDGHESPDPHATWLLHRSSGPQKQNVWLESTQQLQLPDPHGIAVLHGRLRLHPEHVLVAQVFAVDEDDRLDAETQPPLPQAVPEGQHVRLAPLPHGV
jgi:hypothetical protein